jgi:hypothetical protein
MSLHAGENCKFLDCHFKDIEERFDQNRGMRRSRETLGSSFEAGKDWRWGDSVGELTVVWLLADAWDVLLLAEQRRNRPFLLAVLREIR